MLEQLHQQPTGRRTRLPTRDKPRSAGAEPAFRANGLPTDRLDAGAVRDTEDGFRIAEEDLTMRGAGDLIGTAQSGLPKFRVADMERQLSLIHI